MRFLFLFFSFTINPATKLYVTSTTDVKKAYAKAIRKTLNSTTEQVDFTTSARTAKKINDWVAKSTKNLITEIIDSRMLTSETLLVLINCIYFQADWLMNFKKSSTRNAPFYRADGSEKDMSFMSRTGFFQYSSDVTELGHAMAVRLNYKKSNASMTFILPNGTQSLQDWLSDRKSINWTLVDEQMPAVGMVNVTIPKFNITTFKTIDKNLKKVNALESQKSKGNFWAL